MKVLFAGLTLLLLVACNSSEESVSPTPAEDPDALRAKARTAIQDKDYKAAEGFLSAALAQRPADVSSLLGRAGMRLITGDGVGALADYEAAAQLDDVQTAVTRATTVTNALRAASRMEKNKQVKDARRVYDALAVISPRSGIIWHASGMMRLRQQEYDAAIADFSQAIKYDDGNNVVGDSYALRAQARRAAGDETGAKADEALAASAVNDLTERIMMEELEGSQ